MADLNPDGREALFHQMMQRFDEIRARYKGVRGELLQKVRDELMTLNPGAPLGRSPAAPAAAPKAAPTEAPAAPPAPLARQPAPPAAKKAVSTGTMRPSCRTCGRSVEEREDGALVCQKGHVRLLAG